LEPQDRKEIGEEAAEIRDKNLAGISLRSAAAVKTDRLFLFTRAMEIHRKSKISKTYAEKI
jgi:hypothetical protein